MTVRATVHKCTLYARLYASVHCTHCTSLYRAYTRSPLNNPPLKHTPEDDIGVLHSRSSF